MGCDRAGGLDTVRGLACFPDGRSHMEMRSTERKKMSQGVLSDLQEMQVSRVGPGCDLGRTFPHPSQAACPPAPSPAHPAPGLTPCSTTGQATGTETPRARDVSLSCSKWEDELWRL